MNMSFQNKVVLITGAGSGFGEAIAKNFAKLSATLSLIDINGENLEKCVVQCRNLNGGKVLKHVADVRDDELVQRIVNETVEEFGKIDVVVNCAGVMKTSHGSILDSNTMETYDFTMSVNLRAVVRMTNCAAPYLIASKGCIVNIASAAAYLASPVAFAYYLSKSAVNHFTKCVAVELATHGVRANSILPGAAKTNLFGNSGKTPQEIDELFESLVQSSTLKTLIEPEDIANMTVYLASDKAQRITGGDFAVDAGISINRLV